MQLIQFLINMDLLTPTNGPPVLSKHGDFIIHEKCNNSMLKAENFLLSNKDLHSTCISCRDKHCMKLVLTGMSIN